MGVDVAVVEVAWLLCAYGAASVDALAVLACLSGGCVSSACLLCILCLV